VHRNEAAHEINVGKIGDIDHYLVGPSTMISRNLEACGEGHFNLGKQLCIGADVS